MAIHRWGEGVIARTVAIAIVALFVIWGSASFYFIPSDFSTIVEDGEPLTPEVWDELIAYRATGEPGTETIGVKWLQAQLVEKELVTLERKARNDIGLPGAGIIIRQGEAVTDAHLTLLRENKIARFPVQGVGSQKVDPSIIDICTLAQPAVSTTPQTLKAGHVVTEASLEADKKALRDCKDPLGTRAAGKEFTVKRPVDPKKPGGEKKPVKLTDFDKLQVGDEFGEDVIYTPSEPVAAKGTLITQEVYDVLKAAGVTRVEVEDVGDLPVTAEMKAKCAGWFIVADVNVQKNTFWTTEVFTVPAVDWLIDWGVISCFAFCLVLLIFFWNYLNKPKVVDVLVETQQEMKKVSWPSSRELIGSSIVVIAFIFVIGGLLFVSDLVFAALARGIYG